MQRPTQEPANCQHAQCCSRDRDLFGTGIIDKRGWTREKRQEASDTLPIEIHNDTTPESLDSSGYPTLPSNFSTGRHRDRVAKAWGTRERNETHQAVYRYDHLCILPACQLGPTSQLYCGSQTRMAELIRKTCIESNTSHAFSDLTLGQTSQAQLGRRM